jgi:hypothetical protein
MVARTARSRTVRARRAAHERSSKPMAWLARAGLVARGVLYVVIGIIAVQIAVTGSRRQADRTGAVRLVAHTPFGSVLLWLLVAGFAGMTLWRLLEAIWGASGPDGRTAATRLGSLARAVLYGIITYGILEYALGIGQPASSDQQSRDLTAAAMRHPGGQVVVAIAGVVIVIAGLVIMYRAYKRSFVRHLDMSGATPATRAAVTRLGQIGGVARGVVFSTVGVFLVVAAWDASPRQAKGIDSALRALAHTPLGPLLLAVVAIGLVIFGIYSCCDARWRQV